jgi:DNA replication and repair protein RecF
MYIKEIKLHNFRNYETLSLNFSKGINIIYGKNAQGKTNLLESIYVLGITKSHRSVIDNFLIKEGSNYLSIKGIIQKKKFPTTLEFYLSNNKQLKIDGEKINKVSDYISNMNLIIFYPEDLEIIKGSPSVRRRFINLELSQLYNGYYTLLNDYNRLLKMRNDYLKQIEKNKKYDENYLCILNNYFIDKGVIISKMRKKFINLLNDKSSIIFKNITGLDGFHIQYNSNIDTSSDNKEELKSAFANKLSKIFKSEIKLKATLIGPHRDDFDFYLNDKNLKQYGSQGQQRIAVLSVKLAEISIFKEYTGTTPILLLDDIFSELDSKKKNNLLKYIKNNIQTIITTTDLSTINKKIIEKSKLIEIENGKIKKIKEVKENGK